MDLSNKVAVITGAFSGIGEATVRVFIEAGAKVVAVDFNPKLSEVFAGLDPNRLRLRRRRRDAGSNGVEND